MSGISNTISIQVLGDVSNIKKNLQSVESQIGGFGKTFGKIGSVLKGFVAYDVLKKVGGAAIGFAKDSIGEAREAQKAGAQTAAVIKSTGGAANVTQKQVEDLATAISNKTGIDDEQIQSSENMLLTFTNVKNQMGKGNDVFNQATQAVTDLSVATGQNATKSAVMLGKALNDPTRGMSALRRVGVTFTAEQEKQIKTLQKSGDTMGAQKIILAELNKEFGGSAAAQATAGEKAKVAWDNFKESVGKQLLPLLDKFLNFLSSKVIPVATDLAETYGPKVIGFLTSAGSKVAAFFKGFQGGGVATQYVTYLQTVFATLGPIIQGAFSALVQAWPQISAAVQSVITALTALMGFIRQLWTLIGPTVVAQAANSFKMLAGIISGVVTVIAGILRTLTALMTGDWRGAWEGLKTIVSGQMTIVKALVGGYLGNINAITHGMLTKMKDFYVGIWNGIKSFVSGAVEAVRRTIATKVNAAKTAVQGAWDKAKAITVAVWTALKAAVSTAITATLTVVKVRLSSIKSALSSAWSAAKSAAGTAWQQLKDIVTSKLDDVKTKIRDLPGKIKGYFSGAGHWLWDAGSRIIRGLLDGINSKITAVKDKLRSLTDMIPSWKGPANRDAKLLTEAGQLIMESLIRGFDKGESGVKAKLAAVTDFISSALDDTMSPTLSPVVAWKAAGAGLDSLSGSSAIATGGNTYNIAVTAPVGSSGADIGRALVQYIDAYEKAGGRRRA